jgi:hypothetical protein
VKNTKPLERLRYYVTGARERGEATPIESVPIKAFKKHKTKNLYWAFDLKEYVTQNMIPVGSLVIDHNGRDISKLLKV